MELWPVEVTPATAATRMWRNNKNCCYLDVILTKDHQELFIKGPHIKNSHQKNQHQPSSNQKNYQGNKLQYYFFVVFSFNRSFFFSVALSGAPPLHCSVTGKQNAEPWELVAACVAAMAGFICSSSSAKEGWKKNTKEVHLVESLESYNEKWWKMVLKLL